MVRMVPTTTTTPTDPDGDGIYSVTISDLTAVEYKYAINGFADQENLVNDMVDGASCPNHRLQRYANRTVAGSSTNDYYGTCDGVQRRSGGSWRHRALPGGHV